LRKGQGAALRRSIPLRLQEEERYRLPKKTKNVAVQAQMFFALGNETKPSTECEDLWIGVDDV